MVFLGNSLLLAASALEGTRGGGAGLDPSAWPQHFTAGLTIAATSAAQNTTYTGQVWASVPSSQMRYSGSQTTIFTDGTTHTGVFTWIESGVTGLKTLFAPDPSSPNPAAPRIACRSTPMSAADMSNASAASDWVFADYTVIADRIVGVYFDTSVPQPDQTAIFADPFRLQPVAQITKENRGTTTTQSVYTDMLPSTSGTVHSQFSVPPGLKCTTQDDDLTTLPMPKLWL
jgi:hypothetical protein